MRSHGIEPSAVGDRFWPKVNKDGPVPAHRAELGRCWVWANSIYPSGYGQFYVSPGRSKGAHVVSWELANGAVPGGMSILHHCDNPPCVRPDHLFTGTQADNMQDLLQKDRWPETGAKGESNRHAQLTAAQAVELRTRFDAGERAVNLAVEFGVTPRLISRLVTGATWRHIGGPIRSADHPRRRHWKEKAAQRENGGPPDD